MDILSENVKMKWRIELKKLLFFFIILFSSVSFFSDNVRIGFLNVPFFLEETKKGFRGPILDFVKELSEYEDWTIQVVSTDLDKMLQLLHEEKIDMLLPVSYTDEILKDNDFVYNKYSLIPSADRKYGLYTLFNAKSSKKFDLMLSIDHYLSIWKKDKNSPYFKIMSNYFDYSPHDGDNFSLNAGTIIFLLILASALIYTIFRYSKRKQLRKTHEKLSRIETHNLEIMSKTSEMVELISTLGTEKLEEKEFLQKLLHLAISIIPEAEYGSIILKNPDSIWTYSCTIGHNIENFKDIKLNKNYLFPIKGPVVMDNVSNVFFERIPLVLARKIYKGMLPVKSTLVVPLKSINKISGYMMVDIPQKSLFTFSDSSINIMKSLSPLASTFIDYRRMEKKQHQFQESIVRSLIKLLELRDAYTSGHSGRVAFYSKKIAEEMNLVGKKADMIYWAGLLHDIGKVLIDRSILNKPSKLSPEEFEQIKLHPVIGSQVLSETAEYSPLSHIVLSHHESWNGKGYPGGLREEEIPLESRIISVADAFDAMTTDRPYRKALTHKEAVDEIKQGSGIQFDPVVVRAFINLCDSLELYENIETAI